MLHGRHWFARSLLARSCFCSNLFALRGAGRKDKRTRTLSINGSGKKMPFFSPAFVACKTVDACFVVCFFSQCPCKVLDIVSWLLENRRLRRFCQFSRDLQVNPTLCVALSWRSRFPHSRSADVFASQGESKTLILLRCAVVTKLVW